MLQRNDLFGRRLMKQTMSVKDALEQQTAIINFSSRCTGRVPVMSIQMSPSQPRFSLQDKSRLWWLDSWHSNMKLDWKGARLPAWFTGPTLKLQGIFAHSQSRPFCCNAIGCNPEQQPYGINPSHTRRKEMHSLFSHQVKFCLHLTDSKQEVPHDT